MFVWQVFRSSLRCHPVRTTWQQRTKSQRTEEYSREDRARFFEQHRLSGAKTTLGTNNVPLPHSFKHYVVSYSVYVVLLSTLLKKTGAYLLTCIVWYNIR